MIKELNNSHQKRYIDVMKYHSNIPRTIKSVINFRIKVLEHKNQYGINSAIDAFNVSRSTIYSWQKAYIASLNNAKSLTPKSTRPKHVRISKIDYHVADQIIKLRNQYGNLGKSKLKVFLDEFCKENQLPKVSESSIGRCIKRLKNRGAIKQYHRVSYYGRTGKIRDFKFKQKVIKQRRNGYYPKIPGDLVQIDCVIKLKNGIRRYVVSAIDYKSSFAYSLAYSKLDSMSTSDFMDKLIKVAPFTISHIQTDNGSEFYSHFDLKLSELGIVHFWNYTRKPIYNGKIERYNRTSQEEFIDPSITLLFQDIGQFNNKLADWLLYYNTKRPHFAHRDNNNLQIPPLKAYINMLNLNLEKSNMLWTHTASCFFYVFTSIICHKVVLSYL